MSVDEVVEAWATGLAYAILGPTFLALSMLNCSNVNMVERPRMQGKQKRRHGPPAMKPEIRTYTLNVAIPGKRYAPAAANGAGDHASRALHLVRGHFASYTPERPLFGRVTGRFWIPSHARGDINQGLVKKAYKIISQG